MNSKIRRILSMTRRALDFASAHPVDNAGFKALMDQLEVGVTAINALAEDETIGQSDQHAGTAQRRLVRAQIREQFLVRVVNIGAEAAEANPELLAVFRLPDPHLPSKQFLLSARALGAAAADHADVLQPLGLGSTFVADLNAALDRFEQLGTAIDAGRGKHVGAHQAFRRAVTSCRRCIKALDSWYRATYSPGDAVLEGWINARRTEGPFTRHTTTSGDTPPPPAAVPADKEVKAA